MQKKQTITLDNLRKQIDNVDDQLLRVLAKRMHIVREIGKYKKANDIQPLDKKRWQKVLEDKVIKAQKLHLSERFITKLYYVIHTYALEIEK